jgi:hypothetical protein
MNEPNHIIRRVKNIVFVDFDKRGTTLYAMSRGRAWKADQCVFTPSLRWALPTCNTEGEVYAD